MSMTTAQREAWNYAASFRHHRLSGSTHATCLKDLELLESVIEGIRRRIVMDMAQRGYTWVEIGEALGMSRQGASQKYGPHVARAINTRE